MFKKILVILTFALGFTLAFSGCSKEEDVDNIEVNFEPEQPIVIEVSTSYKKVTGFVDDDENPATPEIPVFETVEVPGPWFSPGLVIRNKTLRDVTIMGMIFTVTGLGSSGAPVESVVEYGPSDLPVNNDDDLANDQPYFMDLKHEVPPAINFITLPFTLYIGGLPKLADFGESDNTGKVLNLNFSVKVELLGWYSYSNGKPMEAQEPFKKTIYFSTQ